MGKRFNPDEFLKGVGQTTNQEIVTADTETVGTAAPAKLAKKTADDSISTPVATTKFNPDAFLAQSGTKVKLPGELSSPDSAADKSSTLDGFIEGAKQGATVGFQDEAEAALTAVAESLRETFTGASTLAPGEGIGAKYTKERDRIRGNTKAIADESPYAFLTGQLLGGSPAAIASGGTGIARNIAASAAQAGATTIGEADKLDQEAIQKAGSSALFAAGLAGVLGAGGKLLLKKGGDLVVKNGKKSFTLGKEMRETFADEAVQRKVAQKMVATPNEINTLVKQTKGLVGQQKNQVIEEFGELPVRVNLKETFGDAFETIGKMDTRVDPKLARAQKAAMQDLFTTKKAIMDSGQEISDGVYEIPLRALDELQTSTKDKLYSQRIYKKFPFLEGKMKGAERAVDKAVIAADTTNGSGQLKDINTAFRALFDMEGKKLSPASIKSISDPQNTTALKQFTEFFSEFDQITPELKQKYMPQVADYVARDLPDTVTKAQIMRYVTGRDPTAGIGTGDFQRAAAVQVATGNPLAAALAATPSSIRAEAVNRLGAAVGQAGQAIGAPGRQAASVLGAGIQGAGRAAGIQTGVALGQEAPLNLGE